MIAIPSTQYRFQVLDDEADFLVIELPEANYGSSNTDLLDQLTIELWQTVEQWPGRPVIVDLQNVVNSGAALLGILASFSKRVRESDGVFYACGDKYHMLKLSWMDCLIPTFESRGKALEMLRHETLVESNSS